MSVRHSIAAAALVREGRLLLVHRHPKRQWYPDCWDLVGGHIEPDETPDEAVRRECLEEIGVRVDDLRAMFLACSDPNIDLHAYLVTQWAGEPTNLAPEEHDDLQWFDQYEIPHLALADPASLPGFLAVLH